MIDLTALNSLIAPLLVAASVLLGIAVADTQEVYIRELTVPPTFTRAGFTPAVVDARLHDRLLLLERTARTRPETRRLATEADKSPLELIAQYLNLTLIARALQEASSLIEYSITGGIVQDGQDHVMRLQVRHRSGSRVNITARRPVAEIEQLLDDGANAILQVIDPHIYCSIRLREGLLATPRNVDRAYACVERTLPLASRADLLWLHNLRGVILFMYNDRAGALGAFRDSLRIDPEFSPALLNLGILYAQNGRHHEAIRAYHRLFRIDTRGESPQTNAAAYSEWGNSLMALGLRDEALHRYAQAVRADPRYALSYFFWADALPPGPEADRLRALGNQVQQLNDQLYTENLVGVIRDMQFVPQHD
jgi:tetratricopeptide (TPR) repeat protein